MPDSFAVSNADRVVFPALGKTKGDVVDYYERLAERVLVHVRDRPLSMKRYPKGLAERGFFQKNVPAHYPPSIGRFAVPRSEGGSKGHRDPAARERRETVYPVLTLPEHVPYAANQGAIELHVPTAEVDAGFRPDRVVLDLDPPVGAVELVRRVARLAREVMHAHGLEPALVATGSKGYHLVAAIEPPEDLFAIGRATHQLAGLLVAAQPELATLEFKIADRGERVYVDWMRNHPLATVVVPYSLRARPSANVATPIGWEELDVLPPDAFAINDVARLLDRPDTVADLRTTSGDAFAASVARAFEARGLELQTFDRFGRRR